MTIPPEALRRNPLWEFIGGEMDAWEDGRAVMSIKLEDRHMNPGGIVHGGVLATLMDEATGRAIASVRGVEVMFERPHSTIEMNASFLAVARVGDEIECEARALRVGRTLAVAEADVRRRGSDSLIAKGRFTYAIPSQPRPR
jgi:uncharacterized protein (TIGR00369 family)